MTHLINRLSGALGASFPARRAQPMQAVTPAGESRTVAAIPASVSPITGTVTTDRLVLPRGLITRTIEAQDSIPEKKRMNSFGNIHASSLSDFCPRQATLAGEAETDFYENVRGSMRVIWSMGRFVEQHVRKQFIAGRNRRGIYGRWTCACGETVRTGFHATEAVCENCKKPLNTYKELTLVDEENKIGGNPDLLIHFQGVMFPLEIKSISGKQFAELNAPKPDHIFQNAMYGHLLRANGFNTHDQGVIFYTSKEYSFKSIYKEFHINFTDPAVRNVVERGIAEARIVRDARAAGTVPPRCAACHSPKASKAKKCQLVATCFSRD